MSKYFEGLDEIAILEAIEVSRTIKLQGMELHEVTRTAGPPKDHFIEHLGQLHPLKATIKQAMERRGIDPADPARRSFTSHSGRNWLRKLGFRTIQIQTPTATRLAETERYIRTQKSLSRPQQASFRASIAEAWSYSCPISGCAVMDALEAAHIVPVSSGGQDTVENGILLRADIHKLFDSGLLTISTPALNISISRGIEASYPQVLGKVLSLPPSINRQMLQDNLTKRSSIVGAS